MKNVSKVREFSNSHYRVLGLVWHDDKLLMTTSRVFDGSHSTEIWDALAGELLYRVDGAETLVIGVSRFRRGAWETYWAVEWGPQRCLRYREGQFKWVGATGEPWAVSGIMWQRKTKPPFPMTGVNGDWPWGSNGFRDNPRIINMQTGKTRITIPAAGFPNTILQHNGFRLRKSMYVFLYFCNNPQDTGIWRPDGWKMRGDYGHGVSCNNGRHIVCTGGKLRVSQGGNENGRIYRINSKRKKVKTLVNTGSKRGIHNAGGADKVYCLMAEPFALWEVDVRDWSAKREWWDMVDLPHSHRSFGGAVVVKLDKENRPERLYWAYSRNRTPTLFTAEL